MQHSIDDLPVFTVCNIFVFALYAQIYSILFISVQTASCHSSDGVRIYVRSCTVNDAGGCVVPNHLQSNHYG